MGALGVVGLAEQSERFLREPDRAVGLALLGGAAGFLGSEPASVADVRALADQLRGQGRTSGGGARSHFGAAVA